MSKIRTVESCAQLSNINRCMEELGETSIEKVCEHICEGRLAVTDFCKERILLWMDKRNGESEADWLAKGLREFKVVLYIERAGPKRVFNDMAHEDQERELKILEELTEVKAKLETLQRSLDGMAGKLDRCLERDNRTGQEVLARLEEIELTVKKK